LHFPLNSLDVWTPSSIKDARPVDRKYHHQPTQPNSISVDLNLNHHISLPNHTMECLADIGFDDDNVSNVSEEAAAIAQTDYSAESRPRTHVPYATAPFTPSLFFIRGSKDAFRIRPVALTQSVTREDLTVEHLSLKRFWAHIEKRLGATPQTHYLLAVVPNECGQPGEVK
jgi:hypothetical protein